MPRLADDGLRDALEAAILLAERCDRRVLDHITWTPPQKEWLALNARHKLFRAGNRFGKTLCGAAEAIFTARNQHPFREVRRGPMQIRVLCTTWQQSVAVMRSYHACLDPDEIGPGTSAYSLRNGYGKENPTIVHKYTGSVIRFRTEQQGPAALASEDVDLYHLDELCKQDVWGEVERRTMRSGGRTISTLTPINNPADWLRQLVANGVVKEVHAKLTVQNLTPEGWSHPLSVWDPELQRLVYMDEDWIRRQWDMVLPYEAPVRLDGEWETRVEGATFQAWDPTRMVSEDLPDDDVELHLGMDHGEGDFREFAVVAAVTRGPYPKVYFLAEYASDGLTTTADDARGVVAALESCQISDLGQLRPVRWADLRSAIGDKPTTGKIGRKSNADLTRELERLFRARGELERNQGLRPAFLTAKTGRGIGNRTVWRGCEWLHQAMVRGDFRVHPRCVQLIESLGKWDGSEAYKDPIDAARYATWPYALRSAGLQGNTPALQFHTGAGQ